MLSPEMQKDGCLRLTDAQSGATLKTIGFFNAYCTGLDISFMPGANGGVGISGMPSSLIQLQISPQRVAVGAIVHDNNWPLTSHGAGESFVGQEPQPKPKTKPGVVSTPPPVGLPRVPKLPPAPPPRLPQTPRNMPKIPPLPHPVLVFLAALFGWHEAGVTNEWEHKLSDKEEKRYRELEAKRSKEAAQGGKLPLWEEEEFQALDNKKYPNGHSPHKLPETPNSKELV